jgi:phosphopantothenoylcysteine synthetase/decarboxylase
MTTGDEVTVHEVAGTTTRPRPLLHLVVGAGQPARDVPDFIPAARSSGWDVCVVTVPGSRRCFDLNGVQRATAHPVLGGRALAGYAGPLPTARAVLVAPATFDLLNKLAAGIADTLALDLLAQAIGAGVPVVVVPWVRRSLSRHPAYMQTLSTLSGWGLTMVNGGDADDEPSSFPWRSALRTVNAHYPES